MKFELFHENPQILHVGTMAPRSYFIPSAPAGGNHCERQKLLNGEWDFKYYESFEDSFVNGFFSGDDDGIPVDTFDMDTITVPSCWQNFGYDRHQYTNVRYPFPYDPPFVPVDNPCGLYARKFTLIEEDLKYVSLLNFEGVDSCFYLWINGTFAGYSQVSHSTSEFDISDLVKLGENSITVLVLKWCDGSYLEDQDKLRMSGIFRDVYIISRPQEYIRDFTVSTKITDNYTNSKLEVKLDKTADFPINAELYDADGKLIGTCDEKDNLVCFNVENVHLWNAETPYQYKLLLVCEDEIIEQKIGFNEVKVENGVVLYNGVKFKLKGVNRHDSDPVTGYTISREQAMKDLCLMKKHNINAIRTSHYPNAPWFPQLCSELGFYVIGESDIESHGCASVFGGYDLDHYSAIAHDERFNLAILDRVKRNVIRDKNNASIFCWSLGNESGWGEGFEIAGRWVKDYDPSRLLHYENCHVEAYGRKNDTSMLDLYSHMYWPTEKIDEYFSDGEIKKPFVQCEFIHAMGNGPGDIADYFERFYKYDGFVGGFVWEWCDHAVYGGRTPNNKPIYRYGGDFGEFPHDGNFCMDGLVYPDRTPHTGLLEYKAAIRPIKAEWEDIDKLTVKLSNMLDFSPSADVLNISYDIICDGEVISSSPVDINILPHTSEYIIVSGFSGEGTESIIFYYTAKNSTPCYGADYELGTDCLVLHSESYNKPVLIAGDIDISEDGTSIYISSDSFSYTISKKTGLFDSMFKLNEQIITKPVEFNIWRAPTDNDQNIRIEWEKFGYNRIKTRVYSLDYSINAEGLAEIKVNYGIAAIFIKKFIDVSAVWTIDAEGNVNVKMDCTKDSSFPYLPRFGLRFSMPKKFSTVDYYGYGPFESYEDKHLASHPDYFTENVSDMHEDYIKPQENSSHWGTENVTLLNGKIAVSVSSEKAFSFNVSEYTEEELTNKKHNYELEKCGDTVLCLDYRMSGIGSNSCGPQLLPQYRMNEEKFSFEWDIQII